MINGRREEEPRTYLGASSIGKSCLRAIQLDYTHTPPDPGSEIAGRIYRIFERGHGGEAKMARWWKMAGFLVKTEGKDGEQFGFSAAGGLFQGHADGVLIGGPAVIRFPALWEHKELGNKGWTKLVKTGLAAAYAYYYAQVQIYMAYLNLSENPAIFSATNADTQEIYYEAVPYDPAMAQKMSDRAVKIIKATEHGELMPRVASNADHFECKFCNFQKRCWESL
jgi:hypothetical protein